MAMKALLVGAGGMGRAWARNLDSNPETTIAGWVDIVPGAAERAADELGLSGVWIGTELGKAIAEARPDFVVDVTVPEAHCEVTLAALEAGLPVIGEKPMASTMDEARQMVAASERAGKLYMVSQSRRYHGGIQRYKELLGELGPLGILNADFSIGARFGGFRDEMPSPLILDMAIHTFDAARYLSDADPVAVYCEEFNPGWSWYQGDACATAIFEMTGGLRFTYRGSWCSEGLHTSWESEWRAVGPNGSAIWDGHSELMLGKVAARGGFHSECQEIRALPIEGVASGIDGSLRDFLRALRTGETPMGECHDNIKSLAMVHAAIESSGSGHRVRVEV